MPKPSTLQPENMRDQYFSLRHDTATTESYPNPYWAIITYHSFQEQDVTENQSTGPLLQSKTEGNHSQQHICIQNPCGFGVQGLWSKRRSRWGVFPICYDVQFDVVVGFAFGFVFDSGTYIAILGLEFTITTTLASELSLEP